MDNPWSGIAHYFKNSKTHTAHTAHTAPTPACNPQVLFTVREDLDNPWSVIARNAQHDAKLREWRSLGPQDKVIAKMADILQQVGGTRVTLGGFRVTHFYAVPFEAAAASRRVTPCQPANEPLYNDDCIARCPRATTRGTASTVADGA